jgi:hypothetical protein
MLQQQILVFVACFVVLALGMDVELGVYDEGIILTGAMRVGTGEVPHRDFYANYGPAQFYLLAWLFKVFGPFVLVERVLDLFVRAITVAVCYGVTAIYCRKSIALAASVLCGLWLFSIPFYGYPILPVMLLVLVSTALVLPRRQEAFSLWRFFGAGASVGLVALFRYDVGLYTFIAVAFVVTLFAALGSPVPRHRMSAIAKSVTAYACGTSVICLPVAIAYLAVAPIGPFIHDIFSFTLLYYPRMRRLPFPGLAESLTSAQDAAVYLPILVCSAAVLGLAIDRAYRHGGTGALHAGRAVQYGGDGLLMLLGLLTAALYVKGWVRVSVLHMLASIIVSILLLACLLERSFYQARIMRVLAIVLCTFAVGASVHAASLAANSRHIARSSVLHRLVATIRSPDRTAQYVCATPPELRSVACFVMAPERIEAARFVAQNTSPDERIFVGLTRHDKIFINDNLTYFAAARLPATRWHHFDPGLQTTAQVQAEIIAELESNRVRYIVLSSEWDQVMEPNDSARSSGINLLDNYIREHYRPIRQYGAISVLVRE